MSFYTFARAVCRGYFAIFHRWQVIGKEHVPMDGPVLLLANHVSLLDPPSVGSGTDRQVTIMAKEELFKVPVLGPMIRALGAFPIKRGAGDRAALRLALGLLEDGKCLLMFPEGTRSKTGEMEEGQTGAAFFALRSQAVIIPAAVVGGYRLFRRTKIVYGKPLDISEFRNAKSSKQTLADLTEHIMSAIEELIREHR
ncbi:MAG: lysophospholipid acyltransferase family protein [Tumebacillaceae bacterium]